MAFKLSEAVKSVVTADVQGKVIVLHGDNNTGKTTESCNLPDPFLLKFESGGNLIDGVYNLSVNTWEDFQEFVLEMTPKSKEKLVKQKELVKTIIVDGIEMADFLVNDYTCEEYEIRSIGEGNGGYGKWKELRSEFVKQITRLAKAGYTVVFIGHSASREEDTGNVRLYPVGDKKMVDAICNIADIIGYVINNGVDADGNDIKSSVSFGNSLKYKARTKIDGMVKYLEVFSAENLQKAIKDGIEKTARLKNIKTVSIEEALTQEEGKTQSLAELKADVKVLYDLCKENGLLEEYGTLAGRILGVDDDDNPKSVSSVTETHIKELRKLLIALNEMVEERGISL